MPTRVFKLSCNLRIQSGILLGFTLAYGYRPTVKLVVLPLVWGLRGSVRTRLVPCLFGNRRLPPRYALYRGIQQ